jgi:hypothetical protein
MLRPDGTDLLVSREFSPIGLGQGLRKRSFLLSGHGERRLLIPNQLQHDTRKIILRLRRKRAQCGDDLIEELCHYVTIKPSFGVSKQGPHPTSLREATFSRFAGEGNCPQCGASIVSARTIESNSSPVTKPSAKASSRSVVPLWCACFATLAALS